VVNLRAGTGVADISPLNAIFLAGYPHVPRISTGIHDPLLASALYLEDGKTSLLLISADVLFISRETATACRDALSRTCRIPASNILISATHTHSAPMTAGMLAWRDDPVVPEPAPDYLGLLCKGIVEAGTQACRAARPAELAVTSAQVSGVGCNRLAPELPFDPEAGILAVRSEGRLVAVDIIYGMHPTVLHEDSGLVSADFPGYTRKALSEAFAGITTIYHTAPSGNLSPRYHVKGQNFSEAERLGRRLGDLVTAALRRLEAEDFRSNLELDAGRTFAEMVPNRFATVADAQSKLEQARTIYAQLKRQRAPQGPLRTAECAVFGCEEGLTLAKAQVTGETVRWQALYRKAEVQAFKIGDCFLVGWPGEQFVEYALEVKRSSPRRAFVIGLANGELQGYIVTPQAREQLSYEAAFALFAAESGAALVDTTLNAIRGMIP
jgi:hypothetical protein